MLEPIPPNGLKRCQDCGSLCDDTIARGWHAAHVRMIDGVARLLNCKLVVLRRGP